MDTGEIQAKATIAGALIVSHAVEIPTIPGRGEISRDEAGIRLRDLTAYIYQLIVMSSGDSN